MGSSQRRQLRDGSYYDWSLQAIKPDRWRPHGIRYRLAWIQKGSCRVLFDNHHGKTDHCHIDGREMPYVFRGIGELFDDFLSEIRKLGGAV